MSVPSPAVPSPASQSIHRSRRRTFCGSQRIALELAAHTPTTPATADSTFCDGRELPVPAMAENCLSLGLFLGLRPVPGTFKTSGSGVACCSYSEWIPAMDYQGVITIEPDKRNGKPCVRGLRITVQDVLEYLAGGMTPEEIIADFPELTLLDIRACLAYAADRERKLFVAA